MKKIIALLIISVFLTSCGNNEEKTEEQPIENNNDVEVNTNSWENLIKEIKEDVIIDEIKEPVETNTWVIEELPVDPKADIKEEDTSKPIIESPSDEDALESEVNDLLDEFIDSLDSYDK